MHNECMDGQILPTGLINRFYQTVFSVLSSGFTVLIRVFISIIVSFKCGNGIKLIYIFGRCGINSTRL